MNAFAESVLFLAASRAFKPNFSDSYPGFWEALDQIMVSLFSFGCFCWAMFLIFSWGFSL